MLCYFYIWFMYVTFAETTGGVLSAIKEDDLQTHAKSNSNAETPSAASISSARIATKSEDKSESTKGKRPRQHRCHQDSFSKEEEKKVSN